MDQPSLQGRRRAVVSPLPLLVGAPSPSSRPSGAPRSWVPLLAWPLLLAACSAGDGTAARADSADAADPGRDASSPDLGPDPADAAVAATDLHPRSPDGALDSGPADAGLPVQPDLGPPSGCLVSGTVGALDGGPLAGLRVILCDARHCFAGTSDEQGRYAIPRVPTGLPLALEPLAEGRGHGGVTLPGLFCAADGLEIAVAPLALPVLGPGVEVDGAVGGVVRPLPELELRLPGGLRFPSMADHAEVRAARLDPAALHPLLQARVQPLAVFVLAPFGTGSPAAPVEFTARLGLPPGTTVQALALDHATGEPVPLFALVVADDGSVSSPPGAGAAELSWLLFAPLAPSGSGSAAP